MQVDLHRFREKLAERGKHGHPEGEAPAEALGDPGAWLAALNNAAWAYRAARETARAIEHTEAALATCVTLEYRHR